MKKRHPEPRPVLTLFFAGIVVLAAGWSASYAMKKQVAVGGDLDQADLVLAVGIVGAGICWIAAWTKARG